MSDPHDTRLRGFDTPLGFAVPVPIRHRALASPNSKGSGFARCWNRKVDQWHRGRIG